MSFETLRQKLTQRMVDNFSAIPDDRIVYGQNRDPLKAEPNDPWARFYFTIANTENAEIGTGFQKYMGFVHLQVFVSSDSGEKSAMEIVDAFKTVFQNQNFSGVQCYTVTPTILGVMGESFQINALCRFEYQIFT